MITELTSHNGNLLTTNKDIKMEVVKFFRRLMGTKSDSLPAINKLIMKKGLTLTRDQQVIICAEVTGMEIWEALQSIDDEKEPGVDGYNVLFFKKSWNIIKENIM